MFASIAARYDVNNRLHTLWRDQAWRRAAVRMADVRAGERALDVACGTGDVARLLRAAGANVVGADFCEAMLRIARARSADIEYLHADAHALPMPDEAFDVVTIAFGLRNLADPRASLREFHRVLRPGGRLVVLEFCRATGPGGTMLRWFTQAIMPRTAGAISGQPVAYRYLHASVQSFLHAETLTATLRDAGFANTTTRTMGLGNVAAIRGERDQNSNE
ncbi:MAG: ubiquinone/menaquinone biosynthesis methyltransferase [Phycisphaerae bacterium]|nr:ubiquinone/menaquinone biosynthesis methyltransferase [Phycisphaerae bacterium]